MTSTSDHPARAAQGASAGHDPARAAQSAVAGQENPARAAPSAVAGQENPARAAQSAVAGQENPARAAQSAVAGQENPARAARSAVAGQENPAQAAQSAVAEPARAQAAQGAVADQESFEVAFRHVDVVFGERTRDALALLDAGRSRDEIIEATGAVIGVADADLAIQEGEICVLMGLSGSGKSTLLRCINRLNRATRGQVLIRDDGGAVDVCSCDARTLRRLRTRRIAMVFQQFALLPWRTVAENVGFGLELRGATKAERDRVVQEKLVMVGLKGWGDKYAHELSGGMQQRVGLARAFATDADILLMDEPFSALDPLIRTRLQDELLDLQRSLRKTIVFVSHDLDEAMKIGSHIAIMEGGRIVQYGAPEQIVLQPASEYVKDFVAHMNPLNVLTGQSLMTRREALAEQDGRLSLEGGVTVELGAAGAPIAGTAGGRPLDLVPFYPDIDLSTLGPESLVLAPLDIKLRTALEIRHHTGHPVVLMADDRMVGVIGEAEIYKGILRQTGIEAT